MATPQVQKRVIIASELFIENVRRKLSLMDSATFPLHRGHSSSFFNLKPPNMAIGQAILKGSLHRINGDKEGS